MTSFIIGAHVHRPVAEAWKPDIDNCTFCRIIYKGAPCYNLYENEKVTAILGELYSSFALIEALMSRIDIV